MFLPGCAAQGKTRAKLMKNVKEAIQTYLEALKETANRFPLKQCNKLL